MKVPSLELIGHKKQNLKILKCEHIGSRFVAFLFFFFLWPSFWLFYIAYIQSWEIFVIGRTLNFEEQYGGF